MSMEITTEEIKSEAMPIDDDATQQQQETQQINQIKSENEPTEPTNTTNGSSDEEHQPNSIDAAELQSLNITTKFHQKLINLLSRNDLKFEQANIWLLNQIIIPLQPKHTNQFSQQILKENQVTQAQLRNRYLQPENDYMIYNTNYALKPSSSNSDPNESIHNISLTEYNQLQPTDASKRSTISKLHIHTCVAFNQLGTFSIPLVVFPRDELEANVIAPLAKTTHIDQTPTGDINENIFAAWLQQFLTLNTSQKPNDAISKPLILLCNSIIPINSDQLADLCRQYNVYILFYPLEGQLSLFTKNLYEKFKEIWRQVLQGYMLKDNVNTQLAFLFMYKQVLRRILTPELIRESFRELLTIYKLPKSLTLPNGYSAIETKSSILTPYHEDTSDENASNPTQQQSIKPSASTSSFDNNQADGSNNESNGAGGGTMSEAEVSEYAAWINYMCSIGCLCVKYTFLRDQYTKQRALPANAIKEMTAGEKKWTDLIRKNKTKFQSNLYCHNEDDYHMKWFDLDVWRARYYHLINSQNGKLKNPSAIWSFDIIQFPYSVASNLMRAPEKDSDRPRNTRTRVSVIFAFNAAGDYIQPYFVYPYNFNSSGDDAEELSSNECYSQNGYVTCRIFNQWLSRQFIPYLQQTSASVNCSSYLLMYCGKLAVFDYANMKMCLHNEIRLLCVTHESLIPFNYLFQKNLRKRQTDLFLDSWRKITAKRQLPYQFKCKAKSLFSDLFMDAFQNCIEEIGDFKEKICACFSACNLWPVNEDEYGVFVANAKAIEAKLPQLPSYEVSPEDMVLQQPNSCHKTALGHIKEEDGSGVGVGGEMMEVELSTAPVASSSTETAPSSVSPPVSDDLQSNVSDSEMQVCEEPLQPLKRSSLNCSQRSTPKKKEQTVVVAPKSVTPQSNRTTPNKNKKNAKVVEKESVMVFDELADVGAVVESEIVLHSSDTHASFYARNDEVDDEEDDNDDDEGDNEFENEDEDEYADDDSDEEFVPDNKRRKINALNTSASSGRKARGTKGRSAAQPKKKKKDPYQGLSLSQRFSNSKLQREALGELGDSQETNEHEHELVYEEMQMQSSLANGIDNKQSLIIGSEESSNDGKKFKTLADYINENEGFKSEVRELIKSEIVAYFRNENLKRNFAAIVNALKGEIANEADGAKFVEEFVRQNRFFVELGMNNDEGVIELVKTMIGKQERAENFAADISKFLNIYLSKNDTKQQSGTSLNEVYSNALSECNLSRNNRFAAECLTLEELSVLYKACESDAFQFLTAVCSHVFKEKGAVFIKEMCAQAPSKEALKQDILKLIKVLAFKLYPATFQSEANWSRCLTMIDEFI